MSKASKRSLRSLASLPSFTMGRKFRGHQIRKSRCLQSLVFFDRQASLRLKYVSGEAHQKESQLSPQSLQWACCMGDFLQKSAVGLEGGDKPVRPRNLRCFQALVPKVQSLWSSNSPVQS